MWLLCSYILSNHLVIADLLLVIYIIYIILIFLIDHIFPSNKLENQTLDYVLYKLYIKLMLYVLEMHIILYKAVDSRMM